MSLRAATDTEIEMAIDDAGNRYARVTKQRDYEGGEEFGFILTPYRVGQDQDGDDVTTCIVEAVARNPKAADALPPLNTQQGIQREIRAAWNSGNPMSTSIQTRQTGRFAPRVLAKKFGIREIAVHRLLMTWLDDAVIETDLVDSHSKKRGLKVLRTCETINDCKNQTVHRRGGRTEIRGGPCVSY